MSLIWFRDHCLGLSLHPDALALRQLDPGATGGNPAAARNRGVPTRTVKMVLSMPTSALAGLAGIILVDPEGLGGEPKLGHDL